jgi:hypothetical protein
LQRSDLFRIALPLRPPLGDILEDGECVDGRGGAGLEELTPLVQDVEEPCDFGRLVSRGALAVEDGEDDGVRVALDFGVERLESDLINKLPVEG